MSRAGLPLIADQRTEVLILGTFPGEESLSKGEYYANSGNQFWRIIEIVISANIKGASYAEKLDLLLAHGIGLWDVFSDCERGGSTDSKIHGEHLNDFVLLKTRVPRLHTICFNGTKPAEHTKSLRQLGYRTVVLPSSSGTNTHARVDQKSVIWRDQIAIAGP